MRHIISLDTILSVVGTLFLCIPLIGRLLVGGPTSTDPFLIYWFGGFFVLGLFVSLLARTFVAALLKGGVLPGAINSIILGAWMFSGVVFGPHPQDYNLNWVLLCLMISLIYTFVTFFVSAMCGILGSLPSFLIGKHFRSSANDWKP